MYDVLIVSLSPKEANYAQELFQEMHGYCAHGYSRAFSVSPSIAGQ